METIEAPTRLGFDQDGRWLYSVVAFGDDRLCCTFTGNLGPVSIDTFGPPQGRSGFLVRRTDLIRPTANLAQQLFVAHRDLTGILSVIPLIPLTQRSDLKSKQSHDAQGASGRIRLGRAQIPAEA